MGFWVSGLRFEGDGLECGVQGVGGHNGSWFRGGKLCGLDLGILGLGFGALGLQSGVQGQEVKATDSGCRFGASEVGVWRQQPASETLAHIDSRRLTGM